jgi:hypothetical protein
MTQGWTEGVAETAPEAGDDVRRPYFQHAPSNARSLNEIDARDRYTHHGLTRSSATMLAVRGGMKG